MPDELEISAAAMSLLGILRVAGKRLGEDSRNLVDQSPPIEADVFAAIRYQRIEEYCSFAEALIREEYPGRILDICPNCSTHSVVHSHCEVCFEDMRHVTCVGCGEDYPVPWWELEVSPRPEISCPHCGHLHK